MTLARLGLLAANDEVGVYIHVCRGGRLEEHRFADGVPEPADQVQPSFQGRHVQQALEILR